MIFSNNSLWSLLKALCAGIIFALLACPVSAHLMPANRGTVSIKGTNAYVVLAVPMSALTGFDQNGDGLINQIELGAANQVLRDQISKRVHFTSDDAAPTETLTYLVSALDSASPEISADYVIALNVQAFAKPPKTLTMSTDLFGTSAKDQSLELKATYGDQTEVVILSPQRPSYRFFKTGFETFIAFVETGVRHIVGGTDHLLFLVALMAVAMTSRQLFLILTGFTLAHALTITLASLGYISVPAKLVEPLIALSIVGLAIDNLRPKAAPSFWIRATVVFACGLLHGLGFASALSSFGLNQNYLALSLLGFNLGVELGQFLFVGVCLTVLITVRHFTPKSLPWLDLAKARLACSFFALAFGLIFLVQRLLPITVS
jgi:hydrogenase/urease accessory protein HupE